MQNTGKLDEAARQLQALVEQPLADEVRCLVCFGCAWAAYAQLRPDEVAPMVSAMLDSLERVDDPNVWDRCFFTSILTGLPGMMPLLGRFASGAMRRAGDAPSQLRAGALHVLTWIAFAQGRPSEAADHLARADEDVRWLGRPRSLMTENWMTHTLLDAVRGDRESSDAAAEENRRDLEEHSMLSNRLTHEYEEIFTHMRAAWIVGNEGTVRRLDAALANSANAYEWPAADDDRRFARAFVALFDGRLADARELLAPLAQEVERSCFFPAMQARLMWADVELRSGDRGAAARVLRPWLDAAHAGGEVGGAFLAGLPVLQRLASAAWGDSLDEADVNLLRRLAASMQAEQLSSATPRQTSTASETIVVGEVGRDRDDRSRELQAMRGAHGTHGPRAAESHEATPNESYQPASPAMSAGPLSALSEREREVLARIAVGDSNKLIARTFALSPHTVKRHVANILDKLGVSTRGQAAAHWRSHVRD